MPPLPNRKHEHFAFLRSRDEPLEAAYKKAGFAPDRGHPARLAARPDVIARIEEMRQANNYVYWARRPVVICALLDAANKAVAEGGAAGIREGRITILEALRLFEEMGEGDGKGPDRASTVHIRAPTYDPDM